MMPSGRGEHDALVSRRYQHLRAESFLVQQVRGGIAQSLKTSSQVSEPRMPSLSSFCAVLKPAVPRSTMNAVSLSAELRIERG